MNDYQKFRAEYPPGKGAELRIVWEAWNELTDFDHEKVLEGLRVWKRSEQWNKDPGGRYIPTALNFLRRELWKSPPGDVRRTTQVGSDSTQVVQNRVPVRNRIDHHIPNFDSEAYRRKAQDPANYVYVSRN